MTPPIPIPPAPPAMRRPAAELRPFAAIFAAFPQHAPEVVQDAIDRHRATSRRCVTVATVGELIGRVPMPQPVEPAMTAAQESVELRQMQRTAEQVSAKPKDRLAEKIARCMNRPPLTEAQEAAYQAMHRDTPTLTWGEWGYWPAANRYAGECQP